MKRFFLASIGTIALASPAALAQPNSTSSLNTNVSTITSAVVNNAAGAVVDIDSYSSASGPPPTSTGIRIDPGRPDMAQIFDDYSADNYFDANEFGEITGFGFGCGFSLEDQSASCGGTGQ